MSKQIAPSRALAAKVIHAALVALKENGGELSGSDVLKEVENRLIFNEWEAGRYEKTGNIRWKSILQFYSIDCVKAGWLLKKNGVWYLTPEGEQPLKYDSVTLLNKASEAYKKWKSEQPIPLNGNVQTDEILERNGEISERNEEINLEQIQETAFEGFKKFIDAKNPYEFQDLAAALLRGMGYFTPFIAPRGKDGGVDIVAYRDPLGTVAPRIKVQVKHREQTASVHEIRQLAGILQKDGDVGIFISTGGFTSDSHMLVRNLHVHIELIDLKRFVVLWQEFYGKLLDVDKALMPMVPVYVLAPDSK